jgi:hypothetical protein
MKTCPACQQTYDDNDLNYCLSDGATLLAQTTKDDAPPTVYMDRARTTNEMNWRNAAATPPDSAPMSPWQNSSMQPPNPKQMYSPPYLRGQDQTLPIISLVLGILSVVVCCYGGIPFGIPALITGYLGFNNTNNNPQQYGGRTLAIAGLVLGGVGFLITLFFVLLAAIS